MFGMFNVGIHFYGTDGTQTHSSDFKMPHGKHE